MQPSGDHTDDDDSVTSDDDDETSVASADAEEQAYLLEIQQDKNGRRTATPSRSSSTGMYRTPVSPTLSRASAHSTARYNNNRPMMTRPNNTTHRGQMRAPSAASSVTGAGAGRRFSQASASIISNTNNPNMNNQQKRRTNNNNNNNNNTNTNNNPNNNNRLGGGMFVEQAAEPFDPHVNPWAQQPSTVRQYKVDDGHSETSSLNEHRSSVVQLPSPVISATSAKATLSPAPHPQHHLSQQPPRSQQQLQQPYSRPPSQQQQYRQQQQPPPVRHMQSPSSAASSMTATGPPAIPRVEGGIGSSSVVSQNNNNNSGLLTDQQYTSVVALGPATKRALDTLQAEIIALNDRIDGLRQELVERDRRKASSAARSEESEDNNESWDGWRWVVKVNIFS
ncbi:hypothetical protein BDA99DRAFT_226002 [Phascolomyces articulosus]|uniref:Uncharacterized protein n=1 Tax=Phascolomyces articulosus TaxID=60185 RepID=A0AAD5JZ78_9FUNG|nr:hypothetical protein BDA99DRAFT_226002 [Phascolomyces articulosus]